MLRWVQRGFLEILFVLTAGMVCFEEKRPTWRTRRIPPWMFSSVLILSPRTVQSMYIDSGIPFALNSLSTRGRW